MRKKLVEKAKEGTLKVVTNGEAKPAPKKRGRWDQTAEPADSTPTPAKKKVLSQDSPWEKEDVSLNLFVVYFTFNTLRTYLLMHDFSLQIRVF